MKNNPRESREHISPEKAAVYLVQKLAQTRGITRARGQLAGILAILDSPKETV